MKALGLIFTLFFSQAAFSELVTVTVPVTEGASSVVVKAFGAKVDACNSHGLFVTEAFGALDGFRVGVFSTTRACPTPAIQEMDLETEVEMIEPKTETSFTFDTTTITDIKIEYK